MEVWLLESYYEPAIYEEILIHIPNTSLWLGDEGLDKERIVDIDFSDTVWDDPDMLFTYLGEL